MGLGNWAYAPVWANRKETYNMVACLPELPQRPKATPGLGYGPPASRLGGNKLLQLDNRPI